ncbi:hypothetical protein RchiOBHm_Chr2g0173951 [Rosa chinensis]|uniref:Uncharacterized protein n=1 Tax=Rosa chinensis TaxID=74649 RepID=A0A2P6S612_ROSCH|nr:hypothetical protein RchiOBHm_Chr2g0173951 [Rosa chinensis]
MGVPQDEHPAIVHKLFRVVEAAVNPEIPVIVCVFHNTHRVVGGDGDGHGHEPCMPNLIPASRSSIYSVSSQSVCL